MSCSSDDDGSGEQTTSLGGVWLLTELNATPATDLNNDGVASVNLLTETTCFDTTAFSFQGNNTGTVNSTIATLEIDQNQIVNCAVRTDSGTYSISGNTLSVTIDINGGTATETRQVVLTGNGSNAGDTLAFFVANNEIGAYVNDPGNTVASSIQNLEFVYTKQ